MIQLLEHKDLIVAEQILAVQRPSYQIESELINYPNLPPLHENATDIQNSDETFVGYWLDGTLAGVLAYEPEDDGFLIGRMVVHPDFFRRGIGRALLQWLETAVTSTLYVSTAAKNQPAIRLYQSKGFAIYQHKTLPDGLELVQLRKIKCQAL